MGAKVPIFFVFLMVLALCSAKPSNRKQYKPCKNLVFYYHDTSYNGTNAPYATSSIVAAPQGANLTRLAPNPFHFGDLIVFDDPITLDNNLHSTPIGRAQGFYVYDSKTKYSSWFSFALVFNSTHQEGTITLAGADPSSMTKPRDITVTGGTGDFFMHRGIATLRGDALEGDYYFRLRVEVKFFECW